MLAATPAFAALMALVVQAQRGAGQGSANPPLYAMLHAQANPFHPTPSGNNTVPGVQGFNAAGADLNLATGLGSVDANLLVTGWGTAQTVPPTLTVTASPGSVSILRGSTASVTLVLATGGAFTGPSPCSSPACPRVSRRNGAPIPSSPMLEQPQPR